MSKRATHAKKAFSDLLGLQSDSDSFSVLTSRLIKTSPDLTKLSKADKQTKNIYLDSTSTYLEAHQKDRAYKSGGCKK